MSCISTERADLFFRRQLTEVCEEEKLSVSENAVVHVAGVLTRQASGPEHVPSLLAPLGIRYLTALHGDAGALQREQLRHIGDVALLLCGFWWQFVDGGRWGGPKQRRYHRELGRQAYSRIEQELFDELAEQFEPLERALALLWVNTHMREYNGLPALLGFWYRNQESEFARIILERKGFPMVHLERTARS